jgi:hypothetical protein
MTVPPSGPAVSLRELASGVDALYLSGRGVIPAGVVDALEEIRAIAVQVNQPLPTVIDGLAVTVAPHGWGKYRYSCEHPGVRIGITTSRHLPTVRLQPRTEYLHGAGPEQAVAELGELIAHLINGTALSVNRIDLYADWQHWDLSTRDRECFVGQADMARTYVQAGDPSGFDFGTRASHSMVARIYDKTLDIRRTGSTWWHDVWGDRYQPGSPVHRVEFEFTRATLRDFGLSTPAEVLAARADLWAYASEQWLTHRNPTADHTRSRWPLSAAWVRIQHPSLRAEPIGVQRVRHAKRAGSIRKLLPAITGYLAAFGALIGTSDIEDTLGALAGPIKDYETISRVRFSDRIERRRLEQGS